MNPESICVSLETAKKLKEAGLDKDTVFVWTEKDLCYKDQFSWPKDMEGVYPAPTSSEIELPTNKVQILKWWDLYYCEAFDDVVEKTNPIIRMVDDSEVEAKAKMWLYLKEKGLA